MTFSIRFEYVDHRVAGYEYYGAARSLSRKGFATKQEAWSWLRKVEQHAAANDQVNLDSVTVFCDGKAVYSADYGRQKVGWLYDHVDCHGGVFRYVREA